MSETSTRPYLIRAIYEWCADNGYRPFISVTVDEHTQVPREHVRDGEIVLNVSAGATDRLQLGNEFIEFDARFGGVVRHVSVPVENVGAIYAAENGHGMAFDVRLAQSGEASPDAPQAGDAVSDEPAARAPLQLLAVRADDAQAAESAGAPAPGTESAAAAPADGPRALPKAPAPSPAGTDEPPPTATPPSSPSPGGRPRLTVVK